MSFVPLIAIALVLLALYAAFFKLAAFIFKRTRLAWAHSFIFALVLLFVLLGVRGAAYLVSSYVTVSELLVPVAAILSGVLLGGWFFSTRAKNSSGQPLGWTGGLILTLIGFTLLICTGVALILATQYFRNP